MTRPFDDVEIWELREQALAAVLAGAERLADMVVSSTTVTPAIAVAASQVRQELGNYNRLKKAHLRTVAG